jgi:hypothetical protein
MVAQYSMIFSLPLRVSRIVVSVFLFRITLSTFMSRPSSKRDI